ELLSKLLIEMVEMESHLASGSKLLSSFSPAYDRKEIAYHVELLIDDGLIVQAGSSPSHYRVTSAGQDHYERVKSG
ncbi:hypothetical protein ACMWQA_27440, partial [Escherichia coli]|uniref:hypothetical protein n=1 Tax=Escherichia coli TaxID=562 RepID=UPI0039DF46AD